MEENTKCQEKLGLFLVEDCPNPSSNQCENCNKNVCKDHIFQETSGPKTQNLCLSCKAVLDPRLTSKIELYSADRPVWRKKMMNRFHEEYPFLVTMSNMYGPLFAAMAFTDFTDHSSDSSPFDS
jgi:hypothetical protein